MIIDELITKINKLSNPTVVGLDPRLSYIPEFVLQNSYEEYGETLKGAANAITLFNKAIIDAIYDIVPAVKPQIAMYEQFGAEGIQAYIDTITYAKEKGLIVIGDVKRGDIATTAASYSEGHLGRSVVGSKAYEVYKEDFITLNPYLGYDAIEPFLSDCRAYDKGLFVLVKTSNPRSDQIQDLLSDEQPIYEIVGGLVSKWGKGMIGSWGFSSIGAVVGATHETQAKKLRALMPHTFFLVPGYGAQGATAENISVCFNKDGLGAIINSSRGIIAAYTKDPYKTQYTEKEFAQAARQAAIDMREDILEHL